MKLLVDTSALLALILRDDQNHARAAAFVRQHPQNRYILSELVLSELVTRVRARADAERAAAAGADLLRSQRYQVVFVDRALVEGGLALMRRFADKRLSLADAVSFELMQRLGIGAAFSFDRNLRDCGFAMLPG